MKELIDSYQAHLLMLGVLILAPLIGLVWGYTAKRSPLGLAAGLLVGVGNYALWTLYNAITDHLGLDTVKNLLVNLGVFVVTGIAVGLGAGLYNAKRQRTQGGDNGDVAGNQH